jgi:DNA-binding MarR family transcriptional regulator
MDPGNLGNVLGALALHLTDQMRAAAIGPDQDASAMTALVHLAKYPDDSIESLRVPLQLTHSGGVRLVNRLVAAGYVERRAGADARVVALRLTRKGREVAAEAVARREAVLARALQALAPAERDQLAGLLCRVLAHEVPTEAIARLACRWCDYNACQKCPVSESLSD